MTTILSRTLPRTVSPNRLPALYGHRIYAVDEGLIAHRVDDRDMPRRLAVYMDKILIQ